MFKKFFKKKDDGESNATRVTLPSAPSAMYFDKEKGRWRERGKEHLEEEETALAPPPMMGKPPEESTETAAADGPPPPPTDSGPKKEASVVDSMMAAPNLYANRFGAKPKPAAKKLQAPMGAFGAPPAPAKEGEEGEDETQEAPQAANPFAPKGFGGATTQPVNPFAPRAVTGAAVNPNAPKGFREAGKKQERIKAKPSPFIASPFGAPAAPAAEEIDPEGTDKPEEEAGAGEEGEKAQKDAEGDSHPPVVPPSPLTSSMPAYSPFTARPQDSRHIPRGYGAREDDEAEAFSQESAAEAPADTSADGPADTSADAPADTSADAPADTPAESDPASAPAMALRTRASPFASQAVEAEAEANTAVMGASEDKEEDGEVAEEEEGEICEDEAEAEELANDLFKDVVQEEAEVKDVPQAAEEVAEKAAEEVAEEVEEKIEEVNLADPDDFLEFDKTEPPVPAEPEPQATPEAEEDTEVKQPPVDKEVEEELQAEAPIRAESAGGWGDFDFDVEDEVPTSPEESKPEEAAAANGGSTSSWVMLAEKQNADETEASPEASPGNAADFTEAPEDDARQAANGGFNDAWGDDLDDELLTVSQPAPVSAASIPVPAEGEEAELLDAADDQKAEELVPDEQTERNAHAASADLAKLRFQAEELVPDEQTERNADAASADLAKLQKEYEELRQRFEAADALAASQKEMLDTVEAELSSAKARNADLEFQLEDSQRSAAAGAGKEDELSSIQAELSSARTRNKDLELQLEDASRAAATREQELAAKHAEEAAARQLAEAELAHALSQGDAGQQTSQVKLQEAELKAREADAGQEQLRLQLQEAEARCSEVEQRRILLEQEIEGLRSQPQPSDSPQASEEFNLPDFVWSCGNSEVMAFVQKLAAENAELKKSAGEFKLEDSNQAPSKLEIDVDEATAEAAIAFSGSVRESDGHEITPLLGLLKKYMDNVNVCSQVCSALENLTFTDAANRRSIVKNGGVESILTVLQCHEAADAALLRPAVDALWNLTFDEEAIDRASESGAIERVAQVMGAQGAAPELQGGACAVLLNLAVKEQNRVKIVQSGGVALVAAAMQRHSESEEVLEQGCQALYMLAYHEDLRPLVIAANGSNVAALAASCSPGLGGGRAHKWGKWLQEVLAC